MNNKFETYYKNIAQNVFGKYSGQTEIVIKSMSEGFYRAKCINEKTNESEYHHELEEMLHFVLLIRETLNPASTGSVIYQNKLNNYTRLDSKQIIWHFPSAKAAYGTNEKYADDSYNVWEIRQNDVNDLATKYYYEYNGYSTILEHILIAAITYIKAYEIGKETNDLLGPNIYNNAPGYFKKHAQYFILIMIEIFIIYYLWSSIKITTGNMDLILICLIMLIYQMFINNKLKNILFNNSKQIRYIEMYENYKKLEAVAELATFSSLRKNVFLKYLYSSMNSSCEMHPIIYYLADSIKDASDTSK